MGCFETPGQSEICFSSIAESSFISSSMGNHFGIFGRLDFVLAALFLGFMWRTSACSNRILRGRRFGAAGRKKEFRLGEGLGLVARGVRGEFAGGEGPVGHLNDSS